jgi:hypothetical protein
MLIFAAVFGLLNVARVKGLETNLARTTAARDAAEQRRAAQEERLLKRRDTADSAAATTPAAPNPEAEAKAAKAEADLAQVLKDKADLQNKLQASQAEITSLQNRLQEPTPSVEASSVNPGAASSAELQAQLDDTRRQLESAERENAFLSEKLAGGSGERLATSDRTGRLRSAGTTSIQTKRPQPAATKGALGGTVLAVNQAYNFVVLSLGKRQGLQPNTEMVVFRGGTRLGKLRISSVEPATSIGDIMTNSLARGVQVQPGDSVVYAGSHF